MNEAVAPSFLSENGVPVFTAPQRGGRRLDDLRREYLAQASKFED